MLTKLSPTAVSTYLKNRRQFFWNYIFVHPEHPNTVGIIPTDKSQDRYDGDLVFGDVWAKFTHRFYNRTEQTENVSLSLYEFEQGVAGWMLPKDKKRFTEALGALADYYYRTFDPQDRFASEVRIETEQWVGRLDGWMDGKVIHECKATSSAGSLIEQVRCLQNSVQSRLYAVMTRARGICYELAFKDTHVVYRAPVYEFDPESVVQWDKEFSDLRLEILSRETWMCNFDRCNYATKRAKVVCPYRELCEGSKDFSGFVPRTILQSTKE